MDKGGVKHADKGQAAGDPGGLRGFPGGEAGGLSGGERRSKKVNAGTAFRSVEAQAGLGPGVVGDFSAAVEVDGGVGLARGEDLDAARGQEGTQPDAEGEGVGLFQLAVAQAAAGVVSAVSGIEDDQEGGRGSGRWWRRLLGCQLEAQR